MYRESTVKKIEEIQCLLAMGKTRPEVAVELGYSNVSVLYHFATRNKLKWNSEKKNYDATGSDGISIEAIKIVEDYPTGKVANIIGMFEKGIDGREIAKKLRFESYQVMANYMKSEGYIWNGDKNKYEKQPKEIIAEAKQEIKKKPVEKEIKEESGLIQRYADLLRILDENIDKILGTFNIGDSEKTIPRYIISGAVGIKSVNMINSLDSITRDFSNEHNISQKQIYEVALIDFLKKYGYSDEVKARLKI